MALSSIVTGLPEHWAAEQTLHTCTPAGFQQVLRDLRRLATASLADNNSDSVALHQVQDLFSATCTHQLACCRTALLERQLNECIRLSAKSAKTPGSNSRNKPRLTRGLLLPTYSFAHCCNHIAPVLVDGQTPALFAERKAGIGIVDDRAACIATVYVKGERDPERSSLALARSQERTHAATLMDYILASLFST